MMVADVSLEQLLSLFLRVLYLGANLSIKVLWVAERPTPMAQDRRFHSIIRFSDFFAIAARCVALYGKIRDSPCAVGLTGSTGLLICLSVHMPADYLHIFDLIAGAHLRSSHRFGVLL